MKPTEQEVREAIEARRAGYPRDPLEEPLREAIDKYLDVVGHVWIDRSDVPNIESALYSKLWTDLRPSELEGLQYEVDQARAAALEPCEEAIIEEAVAAALRFAVQHPDARRKPTVSAAATTTRGRATSGPTDLASSNGPRAGNARPTADSMVGFAGARPASSGQAVRR